MVQHVGLVDERLVYVRARELVCARDGRVVGREQVEIRDERRVERARGVVDRRCVQGSGDRGVHRWDGRVVGHGGVRVWQWAAGVRA